MKFSSWILVVLLAAVIVPVEAETIPASEAKSHIGESATVCGKVASERTASGSRGEPTFINLDAAYPNQIFTVLIWGEDRANIGSLPAEGSRVCATGVIQNYRGTPEIVVKSRAQLSK